MPCSGATAYSMLTDYELGAVKLLPMPVHLALDAASDALLAPALARGGAGGTRGSDDQDTLVEAVSHA